VIYLVPSDSADEALDTKGTLACSVEAQNAWFEKASGGLRWRFDTFKDPAKGKGAAREIADVTFVRSMKPEADLVTSASVSEELRSLGFSDPNKRYLSYVASEAAACGDAIYPISLVPAGEVDGQYAQVYLKSPEGCKAEDFGTIAKPGFSEAIALQEIVHNDGLTPPSAPHGCMGGTPPGVAHVCTAVLFLTESNLHLDPERVDLMYPYVSVPLSEKVLDRGNDDYFQHPFPHLFDLEDSPYLERVKSE
jgi:hypothetical protein